MVYDKAIRDKKLTIFPNRGRLSEILLTVTLYFREKKAVI